MLKRIIIILLISLSYTFAQTTKHSELNDLYHFLESKIFDTTFCSIDVYDLNTSSEIFAQNSNYLMRPASNMKVLTTATALYFLGPDYNFKTQVFYDGKINENVLNGDIYFVGGFDPDLTFEDLGKMAEKVKDFGINKIFGNVYVDISKSDSVYWGEGWMWDDDPSTDFPYMTSFNVDDDAIAIEYFPDNSENKSKINIINADDYFTIINNSRIGKSSDHFSITRDWKNRNNDILVSGTLYNKSVVDTVKINIVEPEKYFAFLSKKALEINGVDVKGNYGVKTIADTSGLVTELTRPFSKVILNLNKTSDNLSAEMTLRALAYENHSHVAYPREGVKLIDSLITLIGLHPSDYRIVDGSGVSHYNLITTSLLVNVLNYFYNEHRNLFNVLIDSFPIGGVDGTLRHRMKDETIFNNVRAKTGTLSGVSTLTGVLINKQNHKLAFSIMMQNYVGSSNKIRKLQDRICEILSEIGE